MPHRRRDARLRHRRPHHWRGILGTSLMTTLIIISVVAACVGCALWFFARSRTAELDLPGTIVYADEADNQLLYPTATDSPEGSITSSDRAVT